MNSDHLHSLLAVQNKDIRIQHLQHKLENLPEKIELRTCQEIEVSLIQKRKTLQERYGELEETLERSEKNMASLKKRIKHDENKLYSGEIRSTRHLLALQGQVKELQFQHQEIERTALGTLEAIGASETRLDKLKAEIEAASKATEASQSRLATAEQAAQKEIDEAILDRNSISDTVPLPAMESYENLRKRLDGIAVVKLNHGTCEGCHLQLSAVDLDRIRHSNRSSLRS